MRRYYKTFPIEQIDSIDWDKFTQSPDSVFTSVDGSQFIVQFKYRPSDESDALNHEEALTLKHTPEWKDPANEGLI